MGVTFQTTILKAEDSNATGIPVPAEAVAALGTGKRPKVIVTLNGYTYRSTVAPYGGTFLLPLAAVHREAAGVAAGERVEVTLELDAAPRTVAVPPDLAKALAARPGARAAFDAWSFTLRKEAVVAVESAKAEETRKRRIATIVGRALPEAGGATDAALPGTIDEYIAGFPRDVQAILQKVRATIRKAAPGAAETIKYRMPTFTLNGNLIHFAGFQKHIGLYPAPTGVEQFKRELSAYPTAKGSVQFPLDRPIPYALIGRIVRFRVKENLAKAKAKGKK